ncbi:DUF3558 family protein [Gordonia terrae]|uniref:DUF3558 family protein n=1 Tax=Gordonia terrae TaxID=2055 RepID=UPI003F6B90FB
MGPLHVGRCVWAPPQCRFCRERTVGGLSLDLSGRMSRSALQGTRRALWVAALLLLATVSAACTTEGEAIPTPPPTVVGPERSPGPAPWSLPELVHHQCVVLTPGDLARFGFAHPGGVPEGHSYCRWHALPGRGPGAVMFFVPDVRHSFRALAEVYRSEDNFRPVRVAGRSAFVLTDRSQSGRLTCRVWVGVPSGGAIQFEHAADRGRPGTHDCYEALAIATVIAERVR